MQVKMTTIPVAVRQTVEDRLSDRYSKPITVAMVQHLWPSSVFRCTLQSSDGAVPATVIVRIPREGVARSGSAVLDSERIALEYLTAIGSMLAPRFFAGGAEAGFLASEDLGVGPSLLDLLLGINTRAATEGALAFARSLGRLHAQTIHHPPIGLPDAHISVAEHWQQVQEAVTQLGLPAPYGVEKDVAEIDHVLNTSGDFTALSSGDPSVVNCKVIDGTVRFFDFEEACFRHAFIDAVVLRYLYPTGGPAWQLPPGITASIESAYRAELAQVYPRVQEDSRYETGMAAACAAWMIIRMARLLRVDAGPDRDPWQLLPPGWSGPVPMRSRRRQLVSILETSIVAMNRASAFDGLADWCERVTDTLRTRWPEATDELPLYPAFTTA